MELARSRMVRHMGKLATANRKIKAALEDRDASLAGTNDALLQASQSLVMMMGWWRWWW
jgi:hypothetical protein